jgi:hypothetical protein
LTRFYSRHRDQAFNFYGRFISLRMATADCAIAVKLAKFIFIPAIEFHFLLLRNLFSIRVSRVYLISFLCERACAS